MLERLGSNYGQMKESFTQMTATRRVAVLGVLAAVLACFVVLLVWVNKTDFAVLYSDLSQEDAGAIAAKLKERKTPFEVTANGSTLRVPQEVVEETRLYLATEGLPAGGAVGMELFDKTALGTTDFVQRLNYQRALQGELERTIKKFREVDEARVHLNIPKESLFIEEERLPSASVVLKLRPGRGLSRPQLDGIVHLVASSVEGLRSENISIVDTKGGLLYSKEEGTEGALLTESQVQYRRNLEKTLADKVTTMLERVVGPGKAMARVTAKLDFQQISTSEEIYDPDRSVIRSEQRFSEKSTGPARGAAGVPSARYDLGDQSGQAQNQGAKAETYEKAEETTNYEITKINRRVLIPGGEVNRLSVAVIVDGTYKETVEDGKKVQTFVPLTQDELARLEELVRNAVGFDENRGDTVVVSSVPFFLGEEPRAVSWMETIFSYLKDVGRPAFNILLIVLFFLFVVRPLLGWLQREIKPELPAPAEKEALPAAEVEEEPSIEAKMEKGRLKMEKGRLTREHALALAQQDPERSVNLIRSWLEEK